MNTIDVRGMTVTGWTAQTAFFLAPYGTVPILQNPDQWERWAATVISFPAVAAVGVPSPRGFQRWEDWARQFNQTVRQLAT